MGCFWGVEKLFWSVEGVYSTQVGNVTFDSVVARAVKAIHCPNGEGPFHCPDGEGRSLPCRGDSSSFLHQAISHMTIRLAILLKKFCRCCFLFRDIRVLVTHWYLSTHISQVLVTRTLPRLFSVSKDHRICLFSNYSFCEFRSARCWCRYACVCVCTLKKITA